MQCQMLYVLLLSSFKVVYDSCRGVQFGSFASIPPSMASLYLYFIDFLKYFRHGSMILVITVSEVLGGFCETSPS